MSDPTLSEALPVFKSSIEQGDRIELALGQVVWLVKNNHNVVAYVVSDVDTSAPKLTLNPLNTRLFSTPDDPENPDRTQTSLEPIIIGNEGYSFGRANAKDGNVRAGLSNIEISRQHASIAWDDGSKSFIYTHHGKNNGLIAAPGNLAAEKINDEIGRLQSLLEEIENKRKQLDIVKDREEPTRFRIKRYDSSKDKGATLEDTLPGYALYVQIFSALNKELLSDEDAKKLAKAVDIMDGLLKDRTEFFKPNRKNYNSQLSSIDGYNPRNPDTFPCHEEVAKYADEKWQTLQETGQVYMLYSHREHHAICSLEKQGDDYFLTIHNAGDESTVVKSETIKATERIKLNTRDASDIKAFIRCSAEKKLLENPTQKTFDNINNYIKTLIQGEKVFSIEQTWQHRPNCSTRSTREMLRYLLGANNPVFEDLYNFTSDNRNNALEQAKEQLETRIEILEKIHVSLGRMQFNQNGNRPGSNKALVDASDVIPPKASTPPPAIEAEPVNPLEKGSASPQPDGVTSEPKPEPETERKEEKPKPEPQKPEPHAEKHKQDKSDSGKSNAAAGSFPWKEAGLAAGALGLGSVLYASGNRTKPQQTGSDRGDSPADDTQRSKTATVLKIIGVTIGVAVPLGLLINRVMHHGHQR